MSPWGQSGPWGQAGPWLAVPEQVPVTATHLAGSQGNDDDDDDDNDTRGPASYPKPSQLPAEHMSNLASLVGRGTRRTGGVAVTHRAQRGPPMTCLGPLGSLKVMEEKVEASEVPGEEGEKEG